MIETFKKLVDTYEIIAEPVFGHVISYIKKQDEDLAYYIGNNGIFGKSFGKKYFSRRVENKYKPHYFEIKRYDELFKHNLMIPKKEILCAIDDDHGAKDSCLLNRNELKWNEIHGKFK